MAGEAAPSQEPQALAASRGRGDTTHLDVVDRDGNFVSATPSGAWIPSSPVIPALGFPIGTRAQMFVLDPEHPNALAPGKRPRTTLTPSLARLADGRRLAFGTPGGDQQDQWTVQMLLNVVDFGARDLQTAIDAPTVHSLHMPDSFYPRTSQPGAVAAESRIDAQRARRARAPRPPRAARRAVGARARAGGRRAIPRPVAARPPRRRASRSPTAAALA